MSEATQAIVAEGTQPSIEVHASASAQPMSTSTGRRRKRHGARNQHRHKFFVKWLMETFDLSKSSVVPTAEQNSKCNDKNSDMKDGIQQMGEESTQSTSKQTSTRFHVLDVAGGKGEVAARLCMCHRQQVVMVDPRQADIPKCFETLVLPKIPNKWQKRLLDQCAERPNFVRETVDSRFQQMVTTFEEHTLKDSEELQEAVEKASLIIGLHADGATEAIVDAALEYQKPFVVVPCCVFPNLFKSRTIQNETGNWVPVRSHEQFCQFLLAKDPRFRLEILPFEGRNVAIWWDGV